MPATVPLQHVKAQFLHLAWDIHALKRCVIADALEERDAEARSCSVFRAQDPMGGAVSFSSNGIDPG
jgi:hypothetical protein